MAPRIVLDTSVLIAALVSGAGPNREILCRCLIFAYQRFICDRLSWRKCRNQQSLKLYPLNLVMDNALIAQKKT